MHSLTYKEKKENKIKKKESKRCNKIMKNKLKKSDKT